MNAIQLTDKIKSKFGTLSIFAESIGMERKVLTKLLQENDPDILEVLSQKVDNCLPDRSKILFDQNIARIKKAIDDRGGVFKFCEENPQFKSVTVFKIISGERRTVTKIVKSLAKTLKIELI